MASGVRTGIGIRASRYLGPRGASEYAKALESTGQVVQIVLWDQMASGWPNLLWAPENALLAELIPDVDSLQDPFATAAFALVGVDRLGSWSAPDATRREPAEPAQTMLTLAMAAEGRSSLCLGAGEFRHIAPFGCQGSIGLEQLDETSQISRLLLEHRGPVDSDGEPWKPRDDWVEVAGKDRLPEVIAMRSGPKPTDMAHRHADGFGTGTPFVYGDPDPCGRAIEGPRRAHSETGRSPDDFMCALHHIAFVIDEDDDFLRSVDSPLLAWCTGVDGRINMVVGWAPDGIEPVMPLDWHHALQVKPNSRSPDEILTSPARSRLKWCGRPSFTGPRDRSPTRSGPTRRRRVAEPDRGSRPAADSRRSQGHGPMRSTKRTSNRKDGPWVRPDTVGATAASPRRQGTARSGSPRSS